MKLESDLLFEPILIPVSCPHDMSSDYDLPKILQECLLGKIMLKLIYFHISCQSLPLLVYFHQCPITIKI